MKTIPPYFFKLLGILLAFTALFSCQDEEATAPAPQANFSLSNSSVNMGEMVEINNQSENASAFSWSFGNGETSREKSPSISYMAPGTYTITLIASGAGGSSRLDKKVEIKAVAPQASFQVVNAEALEADVPVVFQNSSIGRNPFAYRWSFGDAANSVSTEKDPSFTYTSPGTYTVSLTVINQDGEHTTSKDIVVNAPPIPNSPAAFYIDTDALSINRVYLGGSSPSISTAFSIEGAGFGVAWDAANELVYYADEASGAIMRTRLDGTEKTTLIADAGEPKSIALDLTNNKIYWTDNAGSTVSVAKLDGSGRQNIITANPLTGAAGDFVGLALDIPNNRIYWTDVISAADEGVYTASLDGSNAAKVVSAWSHAVQVHNGRIYYSNVNSSAIESATIAGTDVQQLGSISYRSYGIAIDAANGKLYWTDLGDDVGLGILRRANLDGSAEESLSSTLTEPRGLFLNL